MIETTTFDSAMPGVSQVDLEAVNFREQFEGRASLDQLVRRDAKQMLQQAIEAEVQEILDQHQEQRDAHGKRLVVRNGHKPSRKIVVHVVFSLLMALGLTSKKDKLLKDSPTTFRMHAPLVFRAGSTKMPKTNYRKTNRPASRQWLMRGA
jgi:hypothetical protein